MLLHSVQPLPLTRAPSFAQAADGRGPRTAHSPVPGGQGRPWTLATGVRGRATRAPAATCLPAPLPCCAAALGSPPAACLLGSACRDLPPCASRGSLWKHCPHKLARLPAITPATLSCCLLTCCTAPAKTVPQVLFQDGRFQWDRLENLLRLAKEGTGGPGSAANAGGGLDLSATVSDGARVRWKSGEGHHGGGGGNAPWEGGGVPVGWGRCGSLGWWERAAGSYCANRLEQGGATISDCFHLLHPGLYVGARTGTARAPTWRPGRSRGRSR
jgi:hypothetical protein